MSSPVRLSLFLTRTAVAFVLALLAGAQLGPDRGDARAARESAGHDEHAAMGMHDANAAAPGLAVDSGGLRLDLARASLPRDRAATLRFTIRDADGAAVRSFDVQHERRMHLILVRRDVRHFQHLHPRLAADGTWSVPVRLDAAGSYRVFADFVHDGQARTLGTDLSVDGDARYGALPAPADTSDAGDGYRVALHAPAVRAGREAALHFAVSRDGSPVSTEPYLGAGGHLVALRDGDLAYMHTHPGGARSTAFATTFDSAGAHRLFFQFRHAGKVRTAAFTVEVGA